MSGLLILGRRLLVFGAILLCFSCFDGVGQNGVSFDDNGKLAPIEKIKAGFIYLGPIGDYGWTVSHDVARKAVSQKYADWLETSYIESVSQDDADRYIKELVEEKKCNVIFATSEVFQSAVMAAAKTYPNVVFMQCAGMRQSINTGTYFADMYQIYYLNGLLAGALTKTGKAGYVASYPTAEVIRHIDAFALGLKSVSPLSSVEVKWINNWYKPDRARQLADELIASGADTLAFSEDSPAVVQAAQASTDRGRPVYVFGHYSPMLQFGETSLVSGQIVDWTGLYESILTSLHSGTWTNQDLWWRSSQGSAILGAEFGTVFNPRFVDALKAVTVKNNGVYVSAYEAVLSRYEELKSNLFEPFTGPIKDNIGNLRVSAGTSLDKSELTTLDWFVENVRAARP